LIHKRSQPRSISPTLKKYLEKN